MTRTWCFVSLFLVSLVVVAAANGLLIRTECAGGHDDWASLRAEVGLLNDGRRIRPNNTADRHEESECRAGTQHVLAECSHDAVWPCAISEDVDGSKDEADDAADRAAHQHSHLELVDV